MVSGQVNPGSASATAAANCASVPGISPGVLRCGFKAIADGFVSNLEPQHVGGNPYTYCVPGPFSIDIGCATGVLIVEEVPSVPQQEDQSYLKFDLSGLPAYILSSHAQPARATLWLFTEYTTGFQNATVQVHRALSNDWSESNLTWNTKPHFSKEYVSGQVTSMNAWTKWDVLAATRNALGNSTEISFALTSGAISPANYVWFRSLDYGVHSVNLTTAPELDMDFTEPLVTILTPYPHLTFDIDQTSVQTD